MNFLQITRFRPFNLRNVNFLAAALALICALALCGQTSNAQLVLSGLLQQGTSANGQTAGSPIWNTVGEEASFANLYVTAANGGYSAAFINHGNGPETAISQTLAIGTYQYYFFCDAFPNNNPGNFGLNLFFNGQSVNPGISAFSPSGVDTATAVAAGLATLSLDGDNANQVSAPGSLTFVAGGLQVALTDYGFGGPGVFSPALDRVGNLTDSPDGSLDGVGFFDLTVTAVPEPSTAAIGMAGLIMAIVKYCQFQPEKVQGVFRRGRGA